VTQDDLKPAWQKKREQTWWYVNDGSSALVVKGARPGPAWNRFMPVLDSETCELQESPLPGVPFVQVQITSEAKRPRRSFASLLLFLPIAGTALWMFTGRWQWFIVGWLALSTAVVVGTVIDNRAVAQPSPTVDVGMADGRYVKGLPFTADIDKLWVTQSSLEAKVLEWLRKYHEGASFEVTEVMAVQPFGNDYAGSTEDGFHSTFNVRVGYRTTDPTRPTLYLDVEGSDLESLWRHVVGGES
jgi:hypothetical protein